MGTAAHDCLRAADGSEIDGAGNERGHDRRSAANIDRLDLQALGLEVTPRQGDSQGDLTVPGEGDESHPQGFFFLGAADPGRNYEDRLENS
jgi:hypothetical protein